MVVIKYELPIKSLFQITKSFDWHIIMIWWTVFLNTCNVKIQFLSSFHRRKNSLTGKDILNAVMLQISIRSDNRNLKSETNWREKKYDGMLLWKKLQRKKSDYQNFATYEILRLLFRYSISNFGSYNNVNFKTYINGIRLIQQRTLLRFYFFFRYWPYLTWILFYSRYWLSLRLRPRPV